MADKSCVIDMDDSPFYMGLNYTSLLYIAKDSHIRLYIVLFALSYGIQPLG